MNNKVSGLIMATAVCALFTVKAGADDAAKTEKAKMPESKKGTVTCQGKNDCAGKGGCQSEDTAVKGKNGCANHAFFSKSEKECKANGGTVMKKKDKKEESTEKKG